MRPLNTVLIAILTPTIHAFDITIYNDVSACSATSATIYRILSGLSDNTCHTFDTAMPDVLCSQYNGGDGPHPCTSDSLIPMSVIQKNGHVACTFYSESGCDGTAISKVDTGDEPDEVITCVDGTAVGVIYIDLLTRQQWDDETDVDTTAGVGCHDGLSTNVCVNDCNCKCSGQVLFCIPTTPTCTPKALALCEEFCDCVNP
ncbi:hypothetical protein K491DRAFT_684787 [Lophiostoma macrostomum CBS 122681]|uniref:Uncharacterized protein n=1 Tax=Lophiostoma macrostomum CBS 122681 TaxID=1314788 RepID=A0A6A6SKD5_9PLEO|nr:hypothetical protein K491DRAFT_684787 [Lophiostoma macrostomum CBS 122681]